MKDLTLEIEEIAYTKFKNIITKCYEECNKNNLSFILHFIENNKIDKLTYRAIKMFNRVVNDIKEEIKMKDTTTKLVFDLYCYSLLYYEKEEEEEWDRLLKEGH